MNKTILYIFLVLLLAGCKKSSDNIIWERSFGSGKALFVKATGDTGYVSCGELDGKLYLLSLDETKSKVIEYKSDYPGSFNAAWTGDNYFIAAGSMAGKMYLSKIDNSGTLVWDSVFTNTFRVDKTALCWLGGTDFLAIGSADPDSVPAKDSGLSFAWFNSDGLISHRIDTTYMNSFIAVNAVTTDNAGNYYLAVTKTGPGGKTKATLVKYNSDFQKIFEKDLSNNPSFGAASLDVTVDDTGNPVVSGRTELQVSTGKENNAFVARYFFSKDSITRKYLEYANSGSSLITGATGEFIVLNQNCMIIDIIDYDIKISGVIRTFNSCDSKSTDSFGYCLDLAPDGNIIIAGTRGKSYWLGLKSSTALSPV